MTDRSRPILGFGYILTLLMVIIPIVDILVQTYPVQTGDTAWRVGSLGRISAGLMMPLLGLFIGAVVAHTRDDKGVIRAIAVVCMLGALLVAIAIPFLMLDALELRRLVRPDVKRVFDFAMMRSVFVLGLMTLSFGWLGLISWRSVPRVRRSGREASDMLMTRG